MENIDVIWKAIPGYEGYEASNTGKIRSLNYRGMRGNVKELSIYVQAGYHKTTICGKNIYVHRLIAKTFLPNWDDVLEVDHINGIRDDNRVENLRMCTKWENNHGDGFHGEKDRQKNAGEVGKLTTAKKVYQYDLDGVFVAEHASVKDVERSTGVPWKNVSDCCRGVQKTTYGYQWFYEHKGEITVTVQKHDTVAKKVACYNTTGKLLTVYDSIYDAAKQIGVAAKGINNCCNGKQHTCAGYVWKYT